MAATALLCRFRTLCVHRSAVRRAVSELSKQVPRQGIFSTAWRQYTAGSTLNPPESDSADGEGTAPSTSIPDADEILNFDPSSTGNVLDNINIGDAEEEYYDDYDADSEAVFDQKASSLRTHGMEYDPRDLLQADRDERRTNKLSQLEKLPIMHVRCTFNNTYVDICDHNGRILTWKSAVSSGYSEASEEDTPKEDKLPYKGQFRNAIGGEGYKRSRRGTSFAAQAAGLAAAVKAREFGFERVRVRLKGPGIGRQYSLKGFELGGLKVASIQDVTPVPHNGCRPRKKRRI